MVIWSYSLISVPFFITMGVLMGEGGISEKLIALANSLVGWMRGGLAMVNIVASYFFGGISGSAAADTASMGSILIPMMVEEGYDHRPAADFLRPGLQPLAADHHRRAVGTAERFSGTDPMKPARRTLLLVSVLIAVYKFFISERFRNFDKLLIVMYHKCYKYYEMLNSGRNAGFQEGKSADGEKPEKQYKPQRKNTEQEQRKRV